MYSLLLIIKAIYFRIISYLPPVASEIDLFGRFSSIKLFFNGEFKLFLEFACNPINIVRYFEIPFVASAIDWDNANNCLDISSPRIYFLYMLNKYHKLRYVIVNPDRRDLDITSKCLGAIVKDSDRVSQYSVSALSLPFESQSFDVVSSISVIEHIPDNGDSLAIREMWRVLKPGGKLILTFPCAKKYTDEFRDQDVYAQGAPQNNEKYFFQRIYNADSIASRILGPIDAVPTQIAFYGEIIAGTYCKYETRWIKKGLAETVKDPHLISTQYRQFDKLENLPGLGVCCLLIEKGVSC